MSSPLRRGLAISTLIVSTGGCDPHGATAPGERVLTLDVAAARVPCVGEMRRDCLEVRVRPATRWELFYDDIEGFTYQPGYEFSIRIARRAVADPPADGSSFAYRLVALLRKTRV